MSTQQTRTNYATSFNADFDNVSSRDMMRVINKLRLEKKHTQRMKAERKAKRESLLRY